MKIKFIIVFLFILSVNLVGDSRCEDVYRRYDFLIDTKPIKNFKRVCNNNRIERYMRYVDDKDKKTAGYLICECIDRDYKIYISRRKGVFHEE